MKLGVLVYVERDGKVLMIHRAKEDEHKGLWLAPGGKVEPNEAPLEAAVREVEEETGLVIDPPELKGLINFPDDGDSPFGDEWHVFVYRADSPSGDLIEVCPEGELHWIDKEAVVSLPMWEGDLLFTPKVFETGVFNAKLHYKGSDLVQTVFWK